MGDISEHARDEARRLYNGGGERDIAAALQRHMDATGEARDDAMRAAGDAARQAGRAEAAEARVKELEANQGSAANDAFNAIATLLGCPSWDYPGQLVRDVEALKASKAALIRELEAWYERPSASPWFVKILDKHRGQP